MKPYPASAEKGSSPHPWFTCIRTLPALAAATLLWLQPVHGETEETINKSFNVKEGGQLVVDVDFGSIDISVANGSKVGIQITRRVSRGGKEAEEDFLNSRPVLITQEGNTIAIRSRSESKTLNIWRGGQKTEARYNITLPQTFDARVKTSGGSIDIKDLRGDVNARTSGGGLRFSNLKGPLDGHTSGGSIRVSSCEGSLRIQTSGGGIDVESGEGSLEGRTSGGSVSVRRFGGPLKVSTSGGGIRIEEASGKIDARTSGGSVSATVATISAPVRLSTSGGSVTLSTSPDSAFTLDASSSGGGASSEIPVVIEGKPSKSHLRGTVNGGGNLVELRSSGGGVRIKKK